MLAALVGVGGEGFQGGRGPGVAELADEVDGAVPVGGDGQVVLDPFGGVVDGVVQTWPVGRARPASTVTPAQDHGGTVPH